MSEIILGWIESSKFKTYKISEKQPSKNPGVVRLGRHPDWCDITFPFDEKISRLHAEIFLNTDKNSFYLRKLPEGSRPPIVDGKIIIHGEISLKQGSNIILGQTKITVVNLSIDIPKPGLICPNPECHNPEPRRLVDEKFLLLGCPWCGVSLAGAKSSKF